MHSGIIVLYSQLQLHVQHACICLYFLHHFNCQLTAGDRGIILSIEAVAVNVGTEEALQNHQVVTGGAVHIVQYQGVGVTPETVNYNTFVEGDKN